MYLVLYLIIVNLITCILFGVDKLKAAMGSWRTPERVLLLFTFIGGSVGALVGMQVFRHKTRHWKFRICVPLALLLHIAIIVFLCVKGYLVV